MPADDGAIARLVELASAVERVSRFVEQTFRLSLTEAAILSFVVARGAVDPAQVHDALDLDAAAAASTIDGLARAGLIESDPAVAGRMVATAVGRGVAHELERRFADAQAGLDPVTLGAVREAMGRIGQGLGRARGPRGHGGAQIDGSD